MAVIIGCGALGTASAQILARAGIGKIRIVDRDFVDYSNLQRQIIFDEKDIINQIPKAVAAERYLKGVNSSIEIEGIVADVNYQNIETFIDGAQVVVDGLDNLETRFLINDACLKHKIPWIYGGAISTQGMTMTFTPGEGPCFRCIHPSGSKRHILTCDTVGVLATAPFIIGSIQAAEAIKILVGSHEINHKLLIVDVWRNQFTSLEIHNRPECPACAGHYEYLEGKEGTQITKLCGQNSVQVLNPQTRHISLTELENRLKPLGETSASPFMLKVKIEGREIVVFPDGRAIFKNTSDETLARSLYAKYIGM